MSLPTPYFERDGITLYHGDCREILPLLPHVDLVVTDPPYGIADKWKGGFSSEHGWGGGSEKQSELRNSWDGQPPSEETMRTIISKGRLAIVWGGNYFGLPASRCWLVWNKPERGFTLAEAELAWTNADNVARVYDGNRRDGHLHPTQKPVGLMAWCIGLPWAKNCKTILDPFCGSGTTLVAAKLCGRRAIGIEIEERYCELAARRLSQKVIQWDAPQEAS